jgi:hypothetical protein
MADQQTINTGLNSSKKGSLAILTHQAPRQMYQDGSGVQPSYSKVYTMGKEKSG